MNIRELDNKCGIQKTLNTKNAGEMSSFFSIVRGHLNFILCIVIVKVTNQWLKCT